MRRNRYRSFQDFVLPILLISNELSTAIVVSGSKLCWKVVDGRKIPNCCFNHYALAGHCYECKSGTTSTDGLTCKTCAANQYGHKCKHRCHCETYERCDPEFGCLKLTETSTKLDISSSRQSEHDSLLATTAIENVSNDDDTSTPMLYIILVSAGLITWLIFCWTCSKLLFKIIRPDLDGSRTSHMRLQADPLPLAPIHQEQGNNTQSNDIDGANLVQNRSVLGRNRLPVISQHLYDSVSDIETPNEQQQNDSADSEGASSQSSEEIHCASDISNEATGDTSINSYQKLNGKREFKVHDYTKMNTTPKD